MHRQSSHPTLCAYPGVRRGRDFAFRGLHAIQSVDADTDVLLVGDRVVCFDREEKEEREEKERKENRKKSSCTGNPREFAHFALG